jgi:hypothetical protein
MKMMTRDDIQSELGWTENMIHSLLQKLDSNNARPNKHTGGYTYRLYHRNRVLAVAQSKEGLDAKRRWEETLRSDRPNPGWTTRLGDMGRVLGITAVAVGRRLELLEYRCDKQVTDSAVAAGCGVRRWDGYAMHDDWHPDRVVSAVGLAAQARGDTESSCRKHPPGKLRRFSPEDYRPHVAVVNVWDREGDRPSSSNHRRGRPGPGIP